MARHASCSSCTPAPLRKSSHDSKSGLGEGSRMSTSDSSLSTPATPNDFYTTQARLYTLLVEAQHRLRKTASNEAELGRPNTQATRTSAHSCTGPEPRNQTKTSPNIIITHGLLRSLPRRRHCDAFRQPANPSREQYHTHDTPSMKRDLK